LSASSNTGKKRKPGTFVKGDPRINRNGRPKAFDYIRELAQQIGDEVDPVIKKTNAEIVLRKLMKEHGDKFLEVAYGKTPDRVEMMGNMDHELVIRVVKVDG
jgi:hypothetical protein